MGRFSDWLREIEDILDITLFNQWLWIIVVCAGAIVVFPFLVLIALMKSPPWLGATVTILIIVGWGIAGGYKDWLMHKHKQEKTKLLRQDTVPFNYERLSDKDKEYD
jgi:hypothetical protein